MSETQQEIDASTADDKPPISPKLVVAVVWGFLVPIVVAAVQAGIGYLATDDGRALFSGLPVVLQVVIYAAVAQLAAAIAGYRQPDDSYRARRALVG